MAQLEGKSLISKIAGAVGMPTSTTQRIAAVSAAIVTVERELADLEQQRAARLLDDEPTEVLKLGDKITTARRLLDTHFDRRKALQAQTQREDTERRRQRKAGAIAAWERKFANKVTAAARLDRALAELSASVKEYHEASAGSLPWPADVFPSATLFQHYEGSGSGHALRCIHNALGMRGYETFRSLTELPAEVGSLEEHDRKYGPWLIDQIKEAPLPEQYDDDEGIAAA